MKYSDVSVTPLRGNKYKVNTQIHYRDIIVPEGYRTNGASIPRIFWSIFPPNKSDCLPAVIIHDYLCDLEDYAKADLYFNDALAELDVPKTCRVVMVYAVRLYHKYKYSTKHQYQYGV